MHGTEKIKYLNRELEYLCLSETQIIDFMEEVKSIFVGENDFRCSLELFLNLRIGEIKT